MDRLVARVVALAHAGPDEPAIVAGGSAVSRSQLIGLAGGLREALQAAAEPGPTLVAARTAVELAVAGLALLSLGRTFVPIDPRASDEVLSARAAATGATALIEASGSGWPTAAASLARIPPLGHEPAALHSDPVRPDAIAMVDFTSGSTGAPRAHARTRERLRAQVDPEAILPEDREVGPGDRFGMLLGSTSSALRRLLRAVLVGAPVTGLDARTSAMRDVLRGFADGEVTVLWLIPTYLRRLLAVAEGPESLGSLRLVRTGAEPLYWDDVAGIRRSLSAATTVRHSYGMTEGSGRIAVRMIPPAEPLGTGRVPVGRPDPARRLRLVDGSGRQVRDGEIGMVVIERTGVDAPLATGDLGRLLPDGQLDLVGRADGMAKVAGMRVELGDLESGLRSLPCVADAVAVARSGPDGAAIVSVHLVPGDEAADEEVRGAASRLIAAMEHSRGVETTVSVHRSGLPQLPNGKVDRVALATHPVMVRDGDGEGDGCRAVASDE